VHDSAFYQFTLATLAEGRPWSGALACRARDGSRVLCEPMVSPFAANEHGFTGNFAVRRNLAQRAQRDTALAVAHHEFRAVLAAVPDGVAVLREGKIYFANSAFLSMVGRSEESVIGLAYVDLVYPDDRAQFLEAHETSVTRVRILQADGPPRFAEISTAGALSFEGKPAMILLSRDVTEQRLAEEQLARAEKLSALGALAAGVAHELNNPLAYLLLNLSFLQESSRLDGQGLEALTDAADGAKRIQQIVSELRGYSGTDAPGPPEAVDVSKAVVSAINIAQNEIRHRARLDRRLESKLFVLAREGQLVQVLVNVLVNAAQAIPVSDGRTHTIAVSSESADDGTAVIEISDTGVGIAPSQLSHLFEPFSTTKRRGEGSGLGLAISKRMIEEVGGKISIRSTYGVGTTVRIELQRARGHASYSDAPLAPRYERSAHDEQRIRLLIVDDEITIASTLQRMLPQYEITTAVDAAEALALLRGDTWFDVVLCDLMMPGVSGPELYAEATRSYPSLGSRFVFMTGGAFTDSAREFLERTRRPILTKPFSTLSACRVVEQVAGQHNGTPIKALQPAPITSVEREP
jgi:PAS domain S-box-containing protein